MPLNVGFVSTRFAGTDGVTLESSKWAEVFQQNGHHCYWFAGDLDGRNGSGYLVKEAHFQDATNLWISREVIGRVASTTSTPVPLVLPNRSRSTSPILMVA